MANKMKSEDMWAVWNDGFGFYVDTRLSRQEMIDKHTSDLGMTWDECKKAGDKCIRVIITAAQPRVHLTSGGRGKNKGRVAAATRK